MRKLKSKVEICKLPLMTPVFLPRYREARKLPPSPRSPSQGIPQKGQAPGRITPWIALGLPHAQVGLQYAFWQASPGSLLAVFTIKLLAETPWALFPLVHGGGHTTNMIVESRKTTSPSDVQQWCVQALSGERCIIMVHFPYNLPLFDD